MYRCISKSCACTLSSKTLVLPSSITSCARFGRWQHARIIPTLHRTHPDVGALGAPNIAGKAASDRKLLGGQGRVLGDVHTEEEALGNASAPVGGPAPRHAGPLLGSIGLDRCKGSNKDSPPPPSPVPNANIINYIALDYCALRPYFSWSLRAAPPPCWPLATGLA
jgi:hypothetical protein